MTVWVESDENIAPIIIKNNTSITPAEIQIAAIEPMKTVSIFLNILSVI